jgi:hypothetical protein
MHHPTGAIRKIEDRPIGNAIPSPLHIEPLAKLNKTVTPAPYRGTGQTPAGVQKPFKNLVSGFHRNDVKGHLQEALLYFDS